jgi:predicted metal-binding membrane protein
MTSSSPLEAVLKRDRLIVLVGLSGVTVLAWLYLVMLAAQMSDSMPNMSGMANMSGTDMLAMLQLRAWTAQDFVLMLLMWVVMMIGMMLPSAAPMILLFAIVNRKSQQQGNPFVPTSAFALGYLLVWSGFSVAATVLQWGLEQAALLSPMMVSTSPLLGGIILVAAGVFQWTPLKQACLIHCRSPIAFIMHGWRPGIGGAIRMGLEHGVYCLGCCWILMGLLFVGGVMSLVWIALITLFVLLEKAAPFGIAMGRASGLLLVLAGLAVMLHADV